VCLGLGASIGLLLEVSSVGVEKTRAFTLEAGLVFRLSLVLERTPLTFEMVEQGAVLVPVGQPPETLDLGAEFLAALAQETRAFFALGDQTQLLARQPVDALVLLTDAVRDLFERGLVVEAFERAGAMGRQGIVNGALDQHGWIVELFDGR
jgi:hypothetical protein